MYVMNAVIITDNNDILCVVLKGLTYCEDTNVFKRPNTALR